MRGRSARQIGDAAALGDLADFRGVDVRMFGRIAIAAKEHERPEQAERSGDEEYRRPAELEFQPHQHRGQERQPDRFRRSIDGDAGGAFLLAEPRGRDPVVDQEGRHLEEAHRHAQRDQHDKAVRQPQRECRQRPEHDDQGIQDARMHPIHQPAAGQLERRVGPAECGEHQAELHRIQMEIARQGGRGDRDVAAVEVVDDHGDEQQSHDPESPIGRRHCAGGVLHLREPIGWHTFPRAMALRKG